jgi:hypothetical protein
VSTIRFICLTPLLCAVSAFPQALASIHCDSQLPSDTIRQTRKKQTFLSPSFNAFKYIGEAATTLEQATGDLQTLDVGIRESSGSGSNSGGALNALSPVQKPSVSKPADFNQDIYYRNKLEFSLDGGWLPINIPFPLDIFVGDAYNTYPLKYTLVPIIASLRWQLDSVGGPWILRGNWDMTFSGSITAIPRGPESRYFSYDMGIRRNFVRRNWKVAPYFDVRLGVGNIDAKGPVGVKYAQGEDLTFTVNMGSGLRYNVNPRYALSAGMNFMHISNLDLSEGGSGKGVWNYGINVYGPMVGIDIQLRRHLRER